MATEEMIRKRVSYRDFRDLSKLLDTKPNKEVILREFWNAIDRHNGYGSQRNADAALESLDLVLRDSAGVKA